MPRHPNYPGIMGGTEALMRLAVVLSLRAPDRRTPVRPQERIRNEMGILSDFFIAHASSTPNYAGGKAFEASDKCEFKSLTPSQTAQFLAVLRGREYVVDLINEFQLLTPEDAEDWTMTVPQDMVDALA